MDSRSYTLSHIHSISHTSTPSFSLIHTLTISFTHSLTLSLPPSLNHTLTHSLTRSLLPTLTHSLTHSLLPTLTHSLPHSLTGACSPIYTTQNTSRATMNSTCRKSPNTNIHGRSTHNVSSSSGTGRERERSVSNEVWSHMHGPKLFPRQDIVSSSSYVGSVCTELSGRWV